MVDLESIERLVLKRRELRWEKERAEHMARVVHDEIMREIAQWKNVPRDRVKESNIFCMRSPVDLYCIFIETGNRSRNKCIFCDAPEEDVL